MGSKPSWEMTETDQQLSCLILIAGKDLTHLAGFPVTLWSRGIMDSLFGFPIGKDCQGIALLFSPVEDPLLTQEEVPMVFYIKVPQAPLVFLEEVPHIPGLTPSKPWLSQLSKEISITYL